MNRRKHININGYKHVQYKAERFPEPVTAKRSNDYYEWLDSRRSVREFSDKPVPRQVIKNLIKSASTAPSGAHKQPWTFCAVSNPELKTKIRMAAEKEERKNYAGRMSERWKEDLPPLGTDENKPFLEMAPWLIIAFKRIFELDQDNTKDNNYYVNESIGIACGILISAIHDAGLVTLPHTPSPMNFLARLLTRPTNERAFLLLPVGYAKDIVYMPDLKRKGLDQMCMFYE